MKTNRRAAGLCLRCGKTVPAPERTLCEPCAEKCRAADRARSARLRTEGKPRRDPEQAKLYERERSRRLHAERAAAGICTKCGRVPARPARTTCEPCAEQHRARDRARHARAKAEGIPYGGRDPEARRRAGRKSSRRRSEARLAAGLCIRCGAVPPEEGRPMCEPCRDDRRDAARARHRERPRRRPLREVRDARAGRQGLLRTLALTKEERRDLKAKRETDRRRYADRRARGIAPPAANRPTGPPSARPAATPPARATTPAAPPVSASSAKPPPSTARPTARPAPSSRKGGATARPSRPPGAGAMPTGGRRANASPAGRPRQGWRAASPVRASIARARGHSAASRSGTRAGR